MKKLTLDETWEKCLEMWKWISEQVDEDDYIDYAVSPVEALKEEWLDDNSYTGKVKNGCFFCAFASGLCENCPISTESGGDYCTDDDGENYEWNPISFYNKIKALNKIRLERRKK